MKCFLWKICVVVLLCSAVALDVASAKKKLNNKYEGDFEFVDEVSGGRLQLSADKKIKGEFRAFSVPFLPSSFLFFSSSPPSVPCQSTERSL